MRTTRLLCSALAALGLTAVDARAAIDCWTDKEHPTTADMRPVADRSVAPMRDAVRAVNTLLHAQGELHALPRSRLRSAWQIGGQWDGPARSAHFLLRDHREEMWVGRCELHPGADRIEPRASIVVQFNAPNTFFVSNVPEVKDERLEAYREWPVTGQVQGHPLYGGHMLVFTANGRLPWVAVTTAEYLDFTERDLERRLAEAEASQLAARRAAEPSAQEATLERVAEGLRKVDPAQAEKLMAEIRAQHAKARAQEEAAAARRRANPALDEAPFKTMLQKVRAWRAGLSPQQMSAQARLGMNGLHDPGLPPERYAPLARPDPAFPWDRTAAARPQMLMVSVRGNGEFEQPMQRVLQRLDVRALQALLK